MSFICRWEDRRCRGWKLERSEHTVVPFLWIFPNHLSFCFWDAEKPCIKKRKRKISSLPSCINWDTHASYIWMFDTREKKENSELQKCHFVWISLCSFLHFLVSTFWLGQASIMLLWVIPSVDQCGKSTHLSFILPADSTPQLKTPLSHCLCECQGSYSWHSTQAQLKSQFVAFWKFSFKKTTFKQIRSIKKKT